MDPGGGVSDLVILEQQTPDSDHPATLASNHYIGSLILDMTKRPIQ